MKKYLKFIIPLLFVILIAFFAIKKIKSRKIEIAETPTPKLPVYTLKTGVVKKGYIYISQNYLGLIEPDKSVNIATKFSGFIKKIYTSEAQTVKKGDLLVKIDAKNIKFQLKNLNNAKYSLIAQQNALKSELTGAISRLKYLKNKYLRDKKLFYGKAISKESFELSETLYKEGKAKLESIKNNIMVFEKKMKSVESQIAIQKDNLKYTDIYSNVDGVVTKIFLHEENMAMPGEAVMNIETTENHKILVDIPVNQATSVKPHNPVEIYFPNLTIKSKINKIYTKSKNNSLVTVEIRIKNLPKNIPTNSYVNISIFMKKVTGLTVPLDSVLKLTDRSYVLTTENGKIKKIPVKIVAENNRSAIVKGNLKAGELVITAMENKLRMLAMRQKEKAIINLER